jgi:hypothetical protein
VSAFGRIRHHRRAFALITALGVLAALTFIVMAAADSTQVTWTFSHARASDQRLGDAIQQLVRSLPPSELVPVPDAAESTAPAVRQFELAKGNAVAGILVFASAPREIAAPPAEVIPPLEGDVLVQFEAASIRLQRVRRTATYLLNTSGNRPAPILVQESRYASQQNQ